MGDDVHVGNIIAAFGGLFLLAVIGFLVAWFSKPDDDREVGGENHPSHGAHPARRP